MPPVTHLSPQQRADLERPIASLAEVEAFFLTVTPWQKIQWGTERVERLLALLGHPEAGRQYITAGGTNAKGSITLYLAALLQRMGYRVGANLSPHVSSMRERIHLGGAWIEERELVAVIDLLRKTLLEWPEEAPDLPTYHELWTVAAIVAFARAEVEWGILEVGMGGRYDAARALDNAVSVFGPIGYDHQKYLGDTLTLIATEKAQIIRPGTLAISAPQDPEAHAVLESHSREMGATWRELDPSRVELTEDFTPAAPVFDYHGESLEVRRLRPGLRGTYQATNAATALLTLEAMLGAGLLPEFPAEPAIREALASVTQRLHPGRFELLATQPELWLEGGHNLNALERFLPDFEEVLDGRPVVLLVGMKEGKDVGGMLALLARLEPVRVVVTQSVQPMALPAEALGQIAAEAGIERAPLHVVPRLEAALRTWVRAVEDANAVGLAIGSLYLAGDLRLLIPRETLAGVRWVRDSQP